MDDLRTTTRVLQPSGSRQPRSPGAGQRGESFRLGRRVLLALLSAAVLAGLMAQLGAAVNVPQAVVVSSNPADWTPPVLDGKVESLAAAPDGLHVFAGGSFTRINGVTQKSLVKLRLGDAVRITAFKGRTNARVKDMAVSGGRLYIGGTFHTVNGVARSALAAVDPVTGALSGDLNLAFTGPRNGTVNIDKLDISPGGSYFVVGTTGAYRAGSLCDTAARWETGATGSGGSAATRPHRPLRVPRPDRPSCPWPAAPRSPSPGSPPSPATCSASAPTAP